MTTKRFNPGRLRTILDCILLLTITVLAVENIHTVQANTDLQATAQETPTVSSQAGPQQDSRIVEMASANPSPNAASLDNNTLAAIIAAENAALTSPQYMTDLPIITH